MFIRTERLFIRPLWPEDAAALLGAFGHWEIVRNLATAPWPYGPAEAEAAIARSAATPAHEMNALIFLRTGREPELVGGIGFGRWTDSLALPEIGYWIAKAHQGSGYAAEAGGAVLEAVFLGCGYEAIGAGHYVDNPASGRVLERIGFQRTGEIIPYSCAARGHEVDSVEYRLTREHWLERRQAA